MARRIGNRLRKTKLISFICIYVYVLLFVYMFTSVKRNEHNYDIIATSVVITFPLQVVRAK